MTAEFLFRSASAVLLAALAADAPATAGRLEFEKLEVDLGEIRQHDVLPLEFPFRVVGGPCVVEEIQASCGCARGELTVGGKSWPLGEPMPDGAAGAVKIDFKAGLYVGEKHATVTVVLGDEAEPVVLEVRTHILQVFLLEPEMARFGEVPRGGEARLPVQVTGLEPWEVVRWAKLPPGVEVTEVEATDGAAEGAAKVRRFEVVLRPGATTRGVYGSAVAETSLDKPLAIPVNAQVVGAVRFKPEGNLRYGIVEEGTGADLLLELECLVDSLTLPEPDLRLDDSEVFSVAAVERRGPERVQIRLRLAPDAPPGRHAATLAVTWSGELARESRKLHVSALVREARD